MDNYGTFLYQGYMVSIPGILIFFIFSVYICYTWYKVKSTLSYRVAGAAVSLTIAALVITILELWPIARW